MNAVWNYLRGGSGASPSSANGASGDDGASFTTMAPLDLLLSETSVDSAAAAVGIRAGRTYVLPRRSGDASSAASSSSTCVATLCGHEDRIWGLAWHPSGDLLVSAGGDKTAKLWIRRPLAAATSADDAAVAAGGDGAATSTPYPYTWECVHTIRNEHAGTIRTCTWSVDGSRLALCSFDGTVSIWIVVLKKGRNGGATATSENLDAAAEDDNVNAGDDDDDEEAGNSSNSINTKDLSVELEITLDGHDSEVKGVAWFADAYNYNYSNDRNAAALKQQTQTKGEEAVADAAESSAVAAVTKEAVSRIVASGSGSDNNSSSSSSYARRPLQIATCSRDRSVWIWEGKQKDEDDDEDTADKKNTVAVDDKGELLLPAARGVEYECAGVLTGHPQDVKSIAWVPSAVLLGNNSHGPILAKACAEAADDDVPEDPIPLSALPPAGPAASGALISCSYDDTARCWEEHRVRKDDWDCVQTLAGHDGTVWECAAQPNAEVVEVIAAKKKSNDDALLEWRHALPTKPIIVTASDDGRLVAWQRTGVLTNGKDNFAQVGSVGGFADGRTVYSVSWAPATTVAVAVGGEESSSSASPLTSSYALAVSDIIAAGTGDDSVAIFRVVKNSDGAADASASSAAADATATTKINTIAFEKHSIIAHAHNSEVNCVRFCPTINKTAAAAAVGDKNTGSSVVELATASDDGEVKIWAVTV